MGHVQKVKGAPGRRVVNVNDRSLSLASGPCVGRRVARHRTMRPRRQVAPPGPHQAAAITRQSSQHWGQNGSNQREKTEPMARTFWCNIVPWPSVSVAELVLAHQRHESSIQDLARLVGLA
jgi:hypothetical protein